MTRNGGGDQSVYVQITRGVAPRDHAFPKETKPTVYAASSPLQPLAADVAEHGVAAISLPDIRWQRCDIKAITLLPNILLRQQAIDQGAVEAILVRDGLVNEGAASNLFIVKAGVLVTPPKGAFLLPGITRDLVLELAAAHGIDHREAVITPQDLAVAEEVWLTSSTREILPVTRLDQARGGGWQTRSAVAADDGLVSRLQAGRARTRRVAGGLMDRVLVEQSIGRVKLHAHASR